MRCRNQDEPALVVVGPGAQILNPGLCDFGCAPCNSSWSSNTEGEGEQDSEIFGLELR